MSGAKKFAVGMKNAFHARLQTYTERGKIPVFLSA